MGIKHKTAAKKSEPRVLLSYLTPQEKHRLVGSFVVENFWDTFIQLNTKSIETFRNIAKESIELFIESYQDVWDYVVDINLLDDAFLTESIPVNKIFKGLSISELKVANKLLALSLYSELEKDCLMALNKTILTELANGLRQKYKFNDEDFQLLMTPSFETFFTKYHFDHFEFAINTDPALKDKQRKQLIVNYHANDQELFNLRFAEMHFQKDSNIADLFSSQRALIADRSAKKLKFIGDREDLKAFEKLLEYDNYLDFKYRYNLEACPEYYVRKILFSACQSKGIFEGVDKPLSLKDAEFINGVNELIAITEETYIIELEDEIDLLLNSKQPLSIKIPVEGSVQQILDHLKKGSPCLLRNSTKKSSTSTLPADIVIVGYSGNVLLGKAAGQELVHISNDDLKSFDEFTVLQKYRHSFFEELNESINKFIARRPYLNREDYESAF